MPGRAALSRRHDSSELDLGRPSDHRGDHRGHSSTHASFPDHQRRCPHSPHTISNRTISSVATNTSRVSPTLCHILRSGRWARAQQRATERLGGMGCGCPRAAPPGGGTGRCGGGPRRDRPADQPPARTAESLEERASRSHYRLIAPGSRSHGERRGRRRTDELPWRTLRGKT